ncbi:hypothetical protein HF086_002189 [Spodoptera exigua]|uniref:Lysozyme n=1 Tax=Spodoptera exigua TaxID=7107 RepID=A0A922MHF7_SPOEX|nr:hypothetical protein HF086_002189 [Spodoptera exigua]
MNRVAWLTCALLSVVGARIYERCELARELESLGVHPDDISTWVCIAYHESRFDTAANNPHSGDHGIFQISELYWCGPGKACGLPCSALRDEDISNDLDCALIVHEEHTRLQGNGFLAWVVYPQHCKHNTKKYLVDCDTNVKSSVPITRSRGYNYVDSLDEQNVTTFRQNTNKALPSFLSIASIVRENYGRVSDTSRGRLDWTDYKIDNIDELRLPVFNQPSQHISLPPATTQTPRTTTPTTTTTTTYIPPVKPWRTIETNQFRKKHRNGDTQKTTKYYDIGYDRYSTASVAATKRPELFTASTAVRNVTTTTLRPATKSTSTWSTTSTWRLPTTTTTYRPPTTSTTTYRPLTSTTTYRPSTTTYRAPTTTTARSPTTSTSFFDKFPSSSTTNRTPSPFSYRFPTLSSTVRPPSTSEKTTWSWRFTTTTPKPSTTSVSPRVVTTTKKPVTTTTQRPTTRTTAAPTTARTPWTWPAFTQRSTTTAVTTKPKTDFSWYTFTSRTSTTPATPKLQSVATKTTPFAFWTKSQSTKANTDQERTTKTSTYSTTKTQTTTTQKPTTQSIFDLYLNPTKRPQLPSYSFSWSQPKLQIFGGSSTTAATLSRG